MRTTVLATLYHMSEDFNSQIHFCANIRLVSHRVAQKVVAAVNRMLDSPAVPRDFEVGTVYVRTTYHRTIGEARY